MNSERIIKLSKLVANRPMRSRVFLQSRNAERAVLFLLAVVVLLGYFPLPVAASGAPVTITFFGDLLLGSHVGELATARGVPFLFAGVSDLFHHDDLTVGNLECCASRRGTAAEKTYTFRMDPSLLAAVHCCGVDVLSLANNHALDYGCDALCDSLDALRTAGIQSVGAGRTEDDAFFPRYFKLKTLTVAVIAATRVIPYPAWLAGNKHPGLAGAYDAIRLCAEIRQARAKADLVVVFLHWGTERETSANTIQRSLAHRVIEAGADLVVGSHPHVLQGFEYYRGKLIAYSLGNFIFTNQRQDTAMLQVTCGVQQILSARIIPCTIQHYRPLPVSDAAGRERTYQLLRGVSSGVGITGQGMLSPVPVRSVAYSHSNR